MRHQEGPRQPEDEHQDLQRWAGLTCLLVALDQVSKLVVRSTLTPGSTLLILGDILSVTFIPNYRGFSWCVPVLPEWVKPPCLLLRLFVLVMAFPVYEFYKRSGRATGWALVALIGISAGILGNMMDDLLMPYTTDFIQVFQSPSASFADLCSFVGLGALVLEVSLRWRKMRPRWQGLRFSWTKATQARREFLRFLLHYLGRKP